MKTLGSLPRRADAVVIGAGLGGLAAALRLGELGARVVLLEVRRQPGRAPSRSTSPHRSTP